MLSAIEQYLSKPALYASGIADFWDDEHISACMLEAHLNPEWDAATRNIAFVDKSAAWIASVAPPQKYSTLLDLGCGPGLYAERFAKHGYSVTGIDLSRRSIRYAEEQTAKNGSSIEYHRQNYLVLDYESRFDVVTIIYCDYAALSYDDRIILLRKAYRALRSGGKLIFDVFTPLMKKAEEQTWQYYPDGGFYTSEPHLCLQSVYRYDEADAELRQCVVVTDNAVRCYNIWDTFFTVHSLSAELSSAGIDNFAFFGDVAGGELTADSQTICVVITKE